MPLEFNTYSFLNVSCSLVGPGGSVSLGADGGGIAEEGITFEPIEDIGTMTVGAGGDVMHSLHAGRPGTATIRLLKTSDNNSVLSQLFSYQAADSTLWGQNTITLTDTSLDTSVSAYYVAFRRHAPLTFSKDGNLNEWNFMCGKITFE